MPKTVSRNKTLRKNKTQMRLWQKTHLCHGWSYSDQFLSNDSDDHPAYRPQQRACTLLFLGKNEKNKKLPRNFLPLTSFSSAQQSADMWSACRRVSLVYWLTEAVWEQRLAVSSCRVINHCPRVCSNGLETPRTPISCNYEPSER